MHDPDPTLSDRAIELNRASWDERAGLHGQDDVFYDTAGVLSGASSLNSLERELVGPVRGRDLVHLQCHIGLDSISWARLGARVTGVDFSTAAVDKARHLAAQADTPVDFVVGDMRELPASLHGRFDVAVATYGIFCWIEDLHTWARNAASTLRPGGRLVIVDNHPLISMIDRADPLTTDFPYANTGPHFCHSDTTYADSHRPLTAGDTVQWAHSIGELVTAIAAADLRIDAVHEPLTSELNIRPDVLTPAADGHWGLHIWSYPLPVLLAVAATKSGSPGTH